jgi:Mrp family chromosome partitioning ATPase
MRGGRARLPVLAELSDPGGEERVWSLRRHDLEVLAGFREWLGERRSLLVTGAEVPARTLAVTLGAVAAAAGLRTLLLECDLAQPRLAVELGLAPTPGLHEYLRWEATPAQVLQSLMLAGPAAGAAEHPLSCVVAGRPAGDPAVLLGLQSFRHMVAKVRAAYDLLVVAGPALDGGEELLAPLAAEVEGALAAVGPKQASGRRRRALAAALSRLPADSIGAVVLGTRAS